MFFLGKINTEEREELNKNKRLEMKNVDVISHGPYSTLRSVW